MRCHQGKPSRPVSAENSVRPRDLAIHLPAWSSFVIDLNTFRNKLNAFIFHRVDKHAADKRPGHKVG
jgi:hypothetical protein